MEGRPEAYGAGEDTLRGRWLTFPMDRESYGQELRYVTQIIGMQQITAMPEMPRYMRGIINLRGRIVPVIDVRLRFGKPEKSYGDRTCIIIIDLGGRQVGLVTDGISEVVTLAEEDVEPPPAFNTASRGLIKGLGKTASSVVLLLDCPRLLDEDGPAETGA